MYKTILPLLRCPHCGAEFGITETQKEGDEIIEGTITCSNGHAFCIHKGVLDFQSQEQELFNSWTKYDEDEAFAHFEQEIDAHKTERQKKLETDFLDAIVAETAKLKKGFLLDIASGRGLLLRKLLQKADANVDIVSVDLSFHALMLDRLKFKKSNPGPRINYIACDATKLPFRDGSIDTACTYVGFTNMLHLMENGIRETARVLKADAPLINSSIYMDGAAEGAIRVTKYLAENDMPGAEKTFLQKELLKIHEKYFQSVREKILYEGIAEKAEGDLIPCEGEWFANALIIAK